MDSNNRNGGNNGGNKKNNRNCEMLLGKAELLSMTDRLLTGGA